jgi:glutaryl-CoA dehydrogenase
VFGALGAARDCLHTALDYAQSRQQFGKPTAAFQMTQDKLATITREYGKGMLLAMHPGRMKDTHGIALAQVSAGKLNNVREALAIARTILGATD